MEESETVTDIVGPENDAKIWHLPKRLLTNNSTFFAAALDGAFAEATTKQVTLAEDDPRVFESFVQWLYYGIRMNEPLQDSTFQDYVMLRLIHQS